jgi:peptidoglycan hydrolase-like protein with peptidoglycan-binding domain
MNTKKKALIVSALLIGVGGYYIYKNMKNKSAEVVPETAESTIDTQKVLAVGSTGEEVKRLQTALKGGLVVDGNFGALTEARLKAITGKTSISIREYNTLMANKTKI